MKKILSFILILLILSIGCIQERQISSQDLITITVKINNGSYIISKNILLPKNSTAFDAFNKTAKLNYTIDPIYGAFVSGINDLEQGNGYYWMFYVDDELAPVGVSSYILNRSLTLEFRYEKPPEFL